VKKALLLIIIIVYGLGLIAQNSNDDIIYPLNKRKAIMQCQILEITEGNLVLYMLDGIDYEIKAIAVKRNGEYIDLKEFDIKPIVETQSDNDNLDELYRGEDYNYYFKESKKAKKLKATGMFFTALGIGTSVIGFRGLRRYIGTDREISNSKAATNSSLLFITGLVILDIGIPLWVAGGIKNSNNKKAMKKCKKPNPSLSLDISTDGIGLVYKF